MGACSEHYLLQIWQQIPQTELILTPSSQRKWGSEKWIHLFTLHNWEMAEPRTQISFQSHCVPLFEVRLRIGQTKGMRKLSKALTQGTDTVGNGSRRAQGPAGLAAHACQGFSRKNWLLFWLNKPSCFWKPSPTLLGSADQKAFSCLHRLPAGWEGQHFAHWTTVYYHNTEQWAFQCSAAISCSMLQGKHTSQQVVEGDLT